MRSGVSILSCIIAVGCTLTPGSGMGGFAEGGATETSDGSDEGAPGSSSAAEASGDDTSEDGGASAGTFEPMDGSSSDGAGSESGGESSGEASTGTPGDTGTEEEPGGSYAPCDTNDDCGEEPAGLACLHADENGAGGFCSPACGTYGATPPDANLCPDAPAGVAATVVCLEGLIRNCALSCQDDAACPDGTACLMANNGNGPYCFGI